MQRKHDNCQYYSPSHKLLSIVIVKIFNLILNLFLTQFSPFEPELAPNCIFFGRKGQGESQTTKVKMTSRINSDYEFHTKKLFSSPIFLGLQMTGPFSCPEFNYDTQIHFPYFPVFFCQRRERKDAEFQLRERKRSLTMISATKKAKISVNGFHFKRVVLPRCLFSFSLLEEAYLTTRIFLGRVDFNFLSYCFGFFETMNRFVKVFWVFSRCFE